MVSIKRGLRTGYKTWTRYKTWTTDFVYKDSFRKVKLRETDSRLAYTLCKTVVPAPWLVMQSIPPTSVWRRKAYCSRARKVKPLLKATENETEFYQKDELEENSNYSFKPTEDVRLRNTEKKK